jgi:NADH dehydrogenase
MPVVALGGGDAMLQPVWVEDVARCIADSIALDATIRQRYELCGPVPYTLHALVAWTLAAAGTPRPILPLPDSLARMLAAVLERLPGRLLTRDNLASLAASTACRGPFPEVFAVVPAPLAALAPGWLAPDSAKSEYDVYRARIGRD